MSTQFTPNIPAKKSKTTEEILKEYENIEELDESVTIEDITDDTVDKIIAGIDEKETAINPEDTENPTEVVSSPLEAENKEMKNTIEALKVKLDESEEDSLRAQLEISSITEKFHQLERICK